VSLAVHQNYSLKGLNTLGFDVVAEHFVQPDTLEALQEALLLSEANQWPVLMLGGGSNLILSNHIPGLVIQLANRGIELVNSSAEDVVVEVAGGENWHQMVETTLEQGWYGLENLALIPGTVGAAPIQNIGAYGVELKDRFVSLQAWDRKELRLVTIEKDQCDFGYRWSRFKGEDAGRYIVWSVRLCLSLIPDPVLNYRVLADQLEQQGIDQPHPNHLFETVCGIRRSKLPDPDELGNAGSFFENPVVKLEQYEQLKSAFPNLVAFADKPGFMKLAAGWLIDQAGWKGCRDGDVGVYDKQALVLVNHGGGDRSQLLMLAGKIQASVLERFGVQLDIEPRQYPIEPV